MQGANQRSDTFRRWPTSALAALTACLLNYALDAGAQTLQAPTMGRMKATDVGIEPAMRLSAVAYARRAAQLNDFDLAAADVALARTRSRAIKSLATRMRADHARLRRALGLVPAAGRMKDLAPMLDQLRRAPASSVDRLFVAQQLETHRRGWALHSGYAADGADARLRLLAAGAVALEEVHLHALPMKPMAY